jgi:hypothetical protein
MITFSEYGDIDKLERGDYKTLLEDIASMKKQAKKKEGLFRKEDKKGEMFNHQRHLGYIQNFITFQIHNRWDRKFLEIMFGGFDPSIDTQMMSRDILRYISKNRVNWMRKDQSLTKIK